MTDTPITMVIPVGKHNGVSNATRLLVNLGTTSWAYQGKPERDSVVVRTSSDSAPGAKTGQRIEVWLFAWAGIPPRVQEHLVRSRALAAGVTLDAARAYLETHKSAIPCSEVELR